MKKILATALLAALSFGATAGTNEGSSLTLGYAQSKIVDLGFKNLKGINAKYRYEWDSPVSVISSVSYVGGKEKMDNSRLKLRNWTFSVGPAFRFNDYVSLYGLVGLSSTKADYTRDLRLRTGRIISSVTDSNRSNRANYGLGIQINPSPEWVIDLAYEGSRPSYRGETYQINTYQIGAGYRF